mmetsp:Transcript_14427/g.24852  ORF Transcript_14427/g.24852 Transcript_14427/m.24852 type:complete len:104 (-) Transcript_14427:281-592(-)
MIPITIEMLGGKDRLIKCAFGRRSLSTPGNNTSSELQQVPVADKYGVVNRGSMPVSRHPEPVAISDAVAGSIHGTESRESGTTEGMRMTDMQLRDEMANVEIK